MIGVDATLANVLADALAHHEHDSTVESLVTPHASAEDPHATGGWLDFERAGRVCATALIEVRAPEGWTGPTPLFAARVSVPGPGASPYPTSHRADAGADESHTGSSAPDLTGVQLVDSLLELAREVMPVDAMRHTWLADELRKIGRPITTEVGRRYHEIVHELPQLTDVQLLTLIERLAVWRTARDRNARRRGLTGLTPGRSA